MMTLIIGAIIVVGQLTEVPKLTLLLLSLVAVVGILFYSNGSAIKNNDGWGAMKYPQLIYGMIGIFVYVGVEVTIDNNFGALLKIPGYLTETGLDESAISKYVSLGSMVASIVFALLLIFGVFGQEIPLLIYFGLFITCLVIFTHRGNIIRIFQGTENRMYLIPRKKQS